MQFKQTLKRPTFFLLMLKTHYMKLLSEYSSPTVFISITNSGIVVSSENQDSAKQTSSLIESQLLNRLSYYQILEVKSSYKHYYTESPTVLKKLQSNDCLVSVLNSYVYISSLTKTVQEIKALVEGFEREDIWTIPYRNPNHLNTLYNQITLYLAKVLKQKEKEFQKMKVVVEIGNGKSHLLIWGRAGAHKMDVKNSLKNIIYCTTVFEIKTNATPDQFKKFLRYLAQITDHPTVMSKCDEGVCRFVTKDSIALQLLDKQKFLRFLNINNQNDVGMFLLQSQEKGFKRHTVDQIASNNGFHIQDQFSFIYFVDCLESKNSMKADHKVQLLKTIIQTLMSRKPKYQSMIPRQSQQKSPNPEEFYYDGEWLKYEDTLDLSSKFGCDIKVRKIYLNAKYLVDYQKCPGEEVQNQLFSKIDWCPSQETKVCSIERGKMKGEYFCGIVKESLQGLLFLPQLLITVL